MVTQPRVAPGLLAQKYIIHRTQRFTRVHAKAMQRWLDDGRGDEEAYYAHFRGEVRKDAGRFAEELRHIEADKAMSFREKREAEISLRQKTKPAWSEQDDENFFRVYGNPYALTPAQLQTELMRQQEPNWADALREGVPAAQPKHEWERKWHAWLTNPQDGSVPVLQAAEIEWADPNAPQDDSIEQDSERGELKIRSADPRFLEAVALAAEKVCPRCYASFQRRVPRNHPGSAQCRDEQQKRGLDDAPPAEPPELLELGEQSPETELAESEPSVAQ